MSNPSAPDPVRRAAAVAGLGYLVVIALFAVVVWSLSNANRPHEVKHQGLAAGMAILAGVLGAWALVGSVRTWRARSTERPLRGGRLLLWGLAASYPTLLIGFLLYLGLRSVI